MAFLPGARLPEDVERGAVGGPNFNTTVLPLDSGFEQRNKNWVDTLGDWDVGFGLLNKFNESGASAVQLDVNFLVNFFYVVNGRADSFRFKDWSDYEVGRQNGTDIDPQFLAFGDGVTATFQAFKRYSLPGVTQVHDRTIVKLVPSTTEVFINGVLDGTATTDDDRGLITPTSVPGDVGSGGLGPGGSDLVTYRTDFDVHVRLDIDGLKINMEIFNVGSWPNIPLSELRGTGL